MSARSVMIAAARGDIERAVKLLEQYNTHERMRECHLRERETQVAARLDLLAHSVGAADDKNKLGISAHLKLRDPLGKLLRGQLPSLYAQRDLVGARRERSYYSGIVLHLYGAQTAIAAEALFIFGCGGAQIRLAQLVNTYYSQ